MQDTVLVVCPRAKELLCIGGATMNKKGGGGYFWLIPVLFLLTLLSGCEKFIIETFGGAGWWR